MICRHPPGYHHSSDTGYSGYSSYSNTPDPKDYEILEVEPVGPHMVVKVKYPSCRNCEFEGNKVIVYQNVTPLDALKWKKIDPHFRRVKVPQPKDEAPSPAARFPADPDGWSQAIAYAKLLAFKK